MSTSPRRAPQACREESEILLRTQPFPYEQVSIPSIGLEGVTSATSSVTSPSVVDAAREAQIRAQIRQEGQAEAQKIFETQIVKERSSLTTALAQFTRDRAAYFQKVEAEVVQLALSITRKILHREAQLDPLLLAGIVRVALEQLDGATGVVLRIHPQNANDWRRYLATHLSPSDIPEIVEDPAQSPDFCKLETAMGTTSFGLHIQLKEIEQGLMDILAARPGASS
jgi:flagellar biosynthesis/type III secretory pathway protein FliH